jgi:hypothetical protein
LLLAMNVVKSTAIDEAVGTRMDLTTQSHVVTHLLRTHLLRGLVLALTAALCASLAELPWWGVLGSFSLGGSIGLLTSALASAQSGPIGSGSNLR